MPKIVTDEDKRMMREAMHEQGIKLIRQKGLRRVTVDEIVDAVGVAKGTFYAYYRSREELLHEIIRTSEKKMFELFTGLDYTSGNFRMMVEQVLTDIYLAEDSIALYVTPEDIQAVVSKLPGQVAEQDLQKSRENFRQTARLFGLDEHDEIACAVLSHLMDALQYTASSPAGFGEESRQMALEIQVTAIAEFIDKRRTNHD